MAAQTFYGQISCGSDGAKILISRGGAQDDEPHEPKEYGL